MVKEDPTARLRSIFDGPPQGLQSLSGNTTTASKDNGTTKTITGFKRTTAADLLELYKYPGSALPSDVTSHRTGSTAGASRSQATSSQLGYITREETNGIYGQFRQAFQSSNRDSKASTSKLKTAAGHAPSKQYTSAYSTSTSKDSKLCAPFKQPSFSKTKGKGKEETTEYEGPNRRKAPIVHESSSEDEMILKDSRTSDSVSRLDRGRKEGRASKNDERKNNVDTCPYAAPEGGVHVPDFLFTPPLAKEASASPPAPVSRTSTSSKENRNGDLVKQSTSKNRKNADRVYPVLPNFIKTRDKPTEKPNDQKKSKRKLFEYVDDMEMDNDDMSPASTLSHSLTHSSTASLEEATANAKIAPSPVKLTPNTQRMLKDAELDDRTKTSAPTYNSSRTSIAARAIETSSSAARTMEDTTGAPKKSSRTEMPDMPDGIVQPARSRSPPIRPRSDARKAKPAATMAGSMTEASSRKHPERLPHISSSLQMKRQLSADRQPLGETTARSSSPSKGKKSSSIAANSKGKGRITDLTTSSPEKPRAITLSSSRYADVDEDNEDSFEVEPSSTIRRTPSSGFGSSPRKPVSSFHLQEKHGRAKDRGAPSPVFQTKSSKKHSARSAQTSNGTRPCAKPAAPTLDLPKAIQPMNLTHLESSAEASRTVPTGKSPRKRTVEVIVHSSPKSKRCTDASDQNRQDKQSKRRSVEKEVSLRYERSESPPDQTQVLWDRAAFRSSSDSDRDKMHESDDDSDGDIRLDNYRETVLCPFCDRALPSRPSKRFVDQLEKLCRRTDLQPRRSDLNPTALRLPATDTALTCKRHRDESEIIPAGEAAGYPVASDVNWKRIIRRIKREIMHDLIRIIMSEVRSTFYENARKEWEKIGSRRMNNARNDFSTFYLELPGYYGQKGFEVIMHVLTTELVSKGILTQSLSTPLDMEVYLRRVLVPETAIRLIQADQKCSASDALKILEESRDYGAAVFGDMDGVNLHLQESQYERSQRHMAEEEEASQREDLLSSQGPEAQALRTGQALITKLRKLCEYHT